MKKILSLMTIAVLSTLVACSVSGPDAGDDKAVINETMDFHGYTIMKFPVEDPEILKAAHEAAQSMQTKAAPTAPASVDLSGNMPPVGNQGSVGSCATWSTIYYCKTYHEKREIGWNLNDTAHQFSPMYAYNQLQSNPSQGVYVSTVMDLVIQQGCDTVNYFPLQTDVNTWVRTLPDQNSKNRAAVYKAASQRNLGGDVNAIKNELAAGNPVVFTIPVYNDFYLNSGNTVYDNFSGGTPGYHAVAVVGYDDARQAFKFVNSWGTGYGSGGYGWIHYSICSRSDFGCSVMYDKANANAPATTIVNGALYEIVNVNSGKAWDVAYASTADGAKVQQVTRYYNSAQTWRINDMGNGLKFTAQCSGKVLDVPGASAVNRAKLQQWTDNGTQAQRWGAGLYGNAWKFFTVINAKCIDIDGASKEDGVQLQLWDDNGNNAQRFYLYKK